jgi:hypothetical protein
MMGMDVVLFWKIEESMEEVSTLETVGEERYTALGVVDSFTATSILCRMTALIPPATTVELADFFKKQFEPESAPG